MCFAPRHRAAWPSNSAKKAKIKRARSDHLPSFLTHFKAFIITIKQEASIRQGSDHTKSEESKQRTIMSRRNRKDVDDLLADLDNLGTEQPTKPSRKSTDKAASSLAASTEGLTAGSKKAPEDAQSLLDDLDSLVQSRAASSSRASQRKKDDNAVATPASSMPTPVSAPAAAAKTEVVTAQPTPSEVPATSTTTATETSIPASSSNSEADGPAGEARFSLKRPNLRSSATGVREESADASRTSS